MSVFAGRVFMLVSVLVAGAGAVVAVLGIRAGSDSGLVGGALAFATFGTLASLVGLVVFPPYVETHVDGERIELRYVFRPRRVVRAEDVDEIVVLPGFRAPGLRSTPAGPRVLLRGGGRVLAAYTPRDHASAQRELAPLGIAPRVDRADLTPGRAHRQYPGSATWFERAMRPICLFAVLVGLGVAVWGLASVL